jgi:hypothetical protein
MVVRTARASSAAHAVRPQQGAVPGDRSAPVVPHDHRLPLAQGIEEADHVAHQVQLGVALAPFGPVGPAIAALIGGHGVVAGLGQRDELVAPGVPGFGEAVEQDDERPRAALGDVHADAVSLDDAMLYVSHPASPCCAG